jgi:hypothetical protein
LHDINHIPFGRSRKESYMNFPSRRLSRSRFASFLCGAAALLIGTLAITASTIALAEPPNRVGRITLTEGDVSFFTNRNEGWQKARLNFPVTSENSVWTQGRARAEVRIGSSAVRIGEDAIVDFIAVNDERTHIFVQRGTVNIRTRSYGSDGFPSQLTVETREGRFIAESDGRYRVDASPDGVETKMMVLTGRARFEGADNVVNVDAGRSLILQNGDARNYRLDYAREGELDRWAFARDRQWDDIYVRYSRERVISPAMTGYEDLDVHGDWVDDREYGRVWAPRVVAAGWAPYRHGSWTYVSPWGWTWVDDAPWGFAPFHYGRWVTIGSRWCWWPGRYQHRPAYAPALVAWHGSPGVSVTVGSSLGWFPLAPHEHYVPRYTNNTTYIRNVNYITNNVTIINAPTRYAYGGTGATFVNRDVFVNSQPVNRNIIVQNPTQITGNYRAVPNLEIAPRFAANQGGGRGTPTPPFAQNPTAITGAPQNQAYPAQNSGGQVGASGVFGGNAAQARLPGSAATSSQPGFAKPGQPPAPVYAGGSRGPLPVPGPAPSQGGVAKPGTSSQPGVAPVPNPTVFAAPGAAATPAPTPQPVYANNGGRGQPKPAPQSQGQPQGQPQIQPQPAPPIPAPAQIGGTPQPTFVGGQNAAPRQQQAQPQPRFEKPGTQQLPQPVQQPQQVQPQPLAQLQQPPQERQQVRQQQQQAREQQRQQRHERAQEQVHQQVPQAQAQPRAQPASQPQPQVQHQRPAPKQDKEDKPQHEKNEGRGNKP